MNQNPKKTPQPVEGIEDITSMARYRRMTVRVGALATLVSVIPLLIMTWINYERFQSAYRTEQIRLTSRVTEDASKSIGFSLQERLAAVTFVARNNSIDELSEEVKLSRILTDMKRAFGGFIDLEFVDPDGRSVSYVGPYPLTGESHENQQWFRQLRLRNEHISEVFLGHRDVPHFVVAVRHENPEHQPFVLRATIDPQTINRQIPSLQGQSTDDMFLVNREGVLQSPSSFYGNVLTPCPLPRFLASSQPGVEEMEDEGRDLLLIGHAEVKDTPFTLISVSRPHKIETWLTLRRNLILFTALPVLLILLVVVGGTRYIVYRLRIADHRRMSTLHNLEYTNKMAAIGRLSAGVAHEINNPLAIIEENAGLLKDLATMSVEPLPTEKVLKGLDSILYSVQRCSAITHRLLGFAKHIDVRKDRVNLEALVKEVLGFLDKEAAHRDLKITLDIPQDLPDIETGRGELQQVFLNIINNAFAAVEDGGKIHISMDPVGEDRVAIHIVDDGVGIPEDILKHIFEPFFTTKKGSGTGLGLSITYGIIQKLGGTVSVKSQVGEGTAFIVVLPIMRA